MRHSTEKITAQAMGRGARVREGGKKEERREEGRTYL
jgi:hypothetical protein